MATGRGDSGGLPSPLEALETSTYRQGKKVFFES